MTTTTIAIINQKFASLKFVSPKKFEAVKFYINIHIYTVTVSAVALFYDAFDCLLSF